jgi:hypothetical protein
MTNTVHLLNILFYRAQSLKRNLVFETRKYYGYAKKIQCNGKSLLDC